MTTVRDIPRVTPAAQLDRDNPWPGLESYDEPSREFFSGRSEESDELLRRILDEPVTILFGKSGLGKTSLLKAGVFPRLRQKDLLPVFVRIQLRPGSEPLIHQVHRTLIDELKAHGIEHTPPADEETLWEFLHRAGQEFWTRHNRLVRPVIVFDQFEELFTLGALNPAEVAAFVEDLADLAENRIPAALARRLDDRPASDVHLDVQGMPYKLVISLREDFLADLEGWRLTMPSLRRNRMRLLTMGAAQALRAVVNEHTNHLVSEPLGQRIVAFLASGPAAADDLAGTDTSRRTVEPALLSLFCRGVNEHRKRDKKSVFDDALLEGGKDTIVSDFYESSLADQPERARRFIEENLVTEHGYRNSYSVEDAVGRGAVTLVELDTLIDRHLLRHEHHLGAERVELTHDLLTRAVIEARDERRRAEREERDRRNRWKRVRTVVIAALLLIVPGFAWLAYRASTAERLATEERDRSRSRELAAVAGARIDTNPEFAMALAIEGLQRADTAEARATLLRAAQYVWPMAELEAEDVGGTPTVVALSADGNRLAVVADDGVTLWDVTTRAKLAVWHGRRVLPGSNSLAFSPDQKMVVVGRRSSITTLDAATGEEIPELSPSLPDVDDRAVTFSPDGRWIGWKEDESTIALLDFTHPERGATRINASKVISFAIVGGDSIVTVSSEPLAAHTLSRGVNGRWTSRLFEMSRCADVQSVSPGTRFLTTNWRGVKCTYATDGSNQDPGVRVVDRATRDIVWSTDGGAFVELLESGELIAARAEKAAVTESSLKGEHQIATQQDLTRLISVSESAGRVAIIDADEHEVVRVFSLSAHKPFMTGFPSDLFALPSHGRWFALADTASGRPPTVDIIPIDTSFPAGTLPRAHSIALDTAPAKLYAASDSVVAVGAQATNVFDAATGQRRYPVLPSAAWPFDVDAELLVVPSPYRIVKTRDGSVVWTQEPQGGSASADFRVSPNHSAFAVFRWTNDSRPSAAVYSIAGTTVAKVGEVHDLPNLFGAFPTDDGRQLVIGEDTFNVTTTGQSGPVRTSPRPDPLSRSPSGTFEVRVESVLGADRTTTTTMSLVRRESGGGQGVVKRFASQLAYRFSSDDRWLAVWSDQGVQVIHTQTGATVLSLDTLRAQDVAFAAADTLISVNLGGDTMLVPIDRALMERFAAWLTTRRLTAEERCLYGLSTEHCE
jgi:hypothetical protein